MFHEYSFDNMLKAGHRPSQYVLENVILYIKWVRYASEKRVSTRRFSIDRTLFHTSWQKSQT
jgi:hypothetical protein